MKLRLIEEYSVTNDTTRYVVERKDGLEVFWRRVESFVTLQAARDLYERFKKAGGEYWNTKVIESWTRGE